MCDNVISNQAKHFSNTHNKIYLIKKIINKNLKSAADVVVVRLESG